MRAASAAESEKLRLVGAPDLPSEAPSLRGAVSPSQLGGLPLLLYIATAVVVVATGFWVVSDISRRHRPIERPRPAALVEAPAPVVENDGPALLPPARLGDGIVQSAPAESPTAPSPAETLNSLIREAEASAAPPAPVRAPMSPEAAPVGAPLSQPVGTATRTTLDAPNVTGEAPPAPLVAAEPEKAETAALPETQAAPALSKCLLKVDGKVLFQRACSAERSRTRATLNLGDKTVLISLQRGETWQASIGAKSLGNVYQTGGCWGRKKQVYICAD